MLGYREFKAAFEHIHSVINHSLLASGNIVLNERVDIFAHESGGQISLPVMGTITVVNDVITVWRDYFDLADFERQLSQIKR